MISIYAAVVVLVAVRILASFFPSLDGHRVQPASYEIGSLEEHLSWEEYSETAQYSSSF
jgi:hypothetical protein